MEQKLKMPHGIIAVHGFRKEYSQEEQIRIANALKPALDLIEANLQEELKKPVIIDESLYCDVDPNVTDKLLDDALSQHCEIARKQLQ